MEITFEHTAAVIGGKEYKLKITRQKGLQEVIINGRPTMVEMAAFIEWPGNMGTTRNYTVVRQPRAADEEAAVLARVQDVAASALINQGIW